MKTIRFYSMLILSIVLGLVPLAGIAWIIAGGTITTVDGLFMSLILAALSGILFLNAVLSLRHGRASTARKTS
jgi:hypothetical protein